MKKGYGRLAITLAVVGLALWLAPNCAAQCGSSTQPKAAPSSWHPQYGPPRFLLAAFGASAHQDDPDADSVSIVGFWHFKFVVGGATVDEGFQQWHSDGTEIMNSGGHPPNTSNFCLGVWEKAGAREYKLSHFPLPWNPTLGDLYPGTNIPMGQPVGTLHIKAKVTLAPDGQSFTGTFTQMLYDTSGNPVPGSKQEGTYTGTRVNVNTPPSSIL
jgi:hypothetical protein